jgi:hypothetical protein
MAAELEAERRAREDQAARLVEMMRFLQTVGQHTGLAMPPSLFAPTPTPPAPTPVSFR